MSGRGIGVQCKRYACELMPSQVWIELGKIIYYSFIGEYWLFFLSKYHLGLQCVLLCFLPPSLTETARAEVFPALIGDHLTRRWFPAMNYICRYAGFSEQEINALTDRVEAYITHGKLLVG